MTFRSALTRRPGGRLAIALVALTALGLPAVALRVGCFGRACQSEAVAAERTPFCSLPDHIRQGIARGFRDGRSGEILAVTGPSRVVGGTGMAAATETVWPSTDAEPERVPLVFWGDGVARDLELEPGLGLDDVASTIASVIGLDRPHAQVRSGDAIDGVATGSAPTLVVEVVWKGIDTAELDANPEAWPRLKSMMGEGAGTTAAVLPSLPHDPAAALTTLGTGGVPAQHGITGTLVRGDSGELVRAWSADSPTNVIASMPDHLDELLDQEPLIALVGTEEMDRGVVGGRWYVDNDRDLEAMLRPEWGVRQQTEPVLDLLRSSALGRDDVPDILAVVQSGSLRKLDRSLGEIVRAAERVPNASVAFVVTATGAPDASDGIPAAGLVQKLERSIPEGPKVVEAAMVGQIYLDQGVLAEAGVSDDAVLEPLLELESAGGRTVMADAFPAVAVTFGKYC